MTYREELLLAIFMACEEEGEDILLKDVLEILERRGFEKNLIDQLMRYSDLPPRIAMAKLRGDRAWRADLQRAATKFLKILEGA